MNTGFGASDISCAATGFCAAVGTDSYVATSTRPASGHANWKLTDLALYSSCDGCDQNSQLTAISCASRRLCITAVYGTESNLAISHNPAAAAPIWHEDEVGDVRGGDGFNAFSCPSRSLCVGAGAQAGTISTSTDTGRRWKHTYVEAPSARNGSLTPALDDVSCPSKTFCAAIDNAYAGHAITTHRPTGGRKAWHRTTLGRGLRLTTLSCASKSLCVGIDHVYGRLVVSTQPTGPGSTWRRAPVWRVTDVSCPSTRLCLLVTDDGRLVVGQRRGR